MLRICEDDGVTEMLLCCRACMSRWTSLESLAAHQRCMCNWKRNRERKRKKKKKFDGVVVALIYFIVAFIVELPLTSDE